jgi:hypothetical protein
LSDLVCERCGGKDFAITCEGCGDAVGLYRYCAICWQKAQRAAERGRRRQAYMRNYMRRYRRQG